MRLCLLALAGLTLLRLILAARLPLTPDEAYYWLWSQHLQAGYFDHPAMVAIWIKAGTLIAGSTPLGVRLLGPISCALGSALLWRAGEDFFPGRNAGIIAAAALNATLLIGVGAIVMTPDTPVIFFWAAAIAGLGRLHATGREEWWLAIGAAIGLALLSKYTAVLLALSIAFWLLASPSRRAALRSIWPWAGAAAAVLVFLPNVIWNAQHHWISYFKQGGRVAGFDTGRAAQYFAELVVSQFGLATPLIFGLAGIGLWQLGRTRSHATAVLIWLTALPLAVFVEHIASGRVEANWPAVLYPSACLAIAALPASILRRWLKPAYALGFAMTGLVYVQAMAAPFPLPAHADPAALQLSGWQGFADKVAAFHPAFVTSDEYGPAAELAFLLPPSIPVVGFYRKLDPRWGTFGMKTAGLAGSTGVLVTRRTDTACPVPLGTIGRMRGNQTVLTYRVCRVVAPAQGVLLPRP